MSGQGLAEKMSEIHEFALLRLKELDQRYTRNRRHVVEALALADAPVTMAGLLGAEGSLAQSSTYRNLAVLEEAGVVHRIVTSDDHARFELTEDITGAHHHHLVCTNCGLVLDITLTDEFERLVHDELDKAAAQSGFHGAHHRIDLLGRCADCGPADAE